MIQPIPCGCGASPVVLPDNPETDGNAWAAVKCINTECPVQPCISDGEDVADERGSNKYKEAAIRRWNTWMK